LDAKIKRVSAEKAENKLIQKCTTMRRGWWSRDHLLYLFKKGTIFLFFFPLLLFFNGPASSSQDRIHHRALYLLPAIGGCEGYISAPAVYRANKTSEYMAITQKVWNRSEQTASSSKQASKRNDSFVRKSPPRPADLWYSFTRSLAIVYMCIYTYEPITSS
jgi:hypothetical protein